MTRLLELYTEAQESLEANMELYTQFDLDKGGAYIRGYVHGAKRHRVAILQEFLGWLEDSDPDEYPLRGYDDMVETLDDYIRNVEDELA